jgi:ribosome-binding protein aMBF1 (putative translation factor)
VRLSLFDNEHLSALQEAIGFSNIGISDLAIFANGITEAAAVWVKMEHYKVVGACLAAARRRAGVSQDELAARLGKPQSFVSEYERGQRRVDVVELFVISRTLGVDALDLFAEIAKTVRAAAPSTTP